MKPTDGLTEGALEALQQRGIDPEVAARLGVVSARPTRGDKADGLEWLSFPHRERPGGPTHWQFRTITGEKDFKSSTGTSDHRTFFNAEALLDPSLEGTTPIITEGQLDTLALMSTGYVRVVSVPDGAPPAAGPAEAPGGKRKYAYLDRFREILARQKEIILATDDDAGGHALRRDLVTRLGPERCKWVTYGGCKDANDLLIEAGPSAVVSAMEQAKWVQLDGLYQDIDDVPPLPESEVMSFGMGEHFDDLWRLQRGSLNVLVGIPSHGKTSLLNDCLTELVRGTRSVVCFASLEQYPKPEHRDNLRRCYLRNDPYQSREERLREADDWIREHFLFIVPARDEPPTFDWLIERAKMAALRANASVLVIDPWNELAHEHRPADIPMHEYIGVMLRKLRRFAQEYHVAVIVAVHPTKMMRDRDGKSPIPTGYDIADSANWVNKADVGLTIYRKSKDRTAIRNWKSRTQPKLGKPGEALFCFYPSDGHFVYVDSSAGDEE